MLKKSAFAQRRNFMQIFTRRDFLKGSSTLVLAAAASGLLCGAAQAPAEAVPMTETVGGLVVHTVRAFAKDYGHNFRHLDKIKDIYCSITIVKDINCLIVVYQERNKTVTV